MRRGGGLPAVPRLAYLAEQAGAQLSGTAHLVLIGARSPVAFFAYPDRPSDLVPSGCRVHTLATALQDVPQALAALAERVGATPVPLGRPIMSGVLPDGPLTPAGLGAAIAAALPPEAIVVDESTTLGVAITPPLADAAAHDVMHLTGGAIGYGLPAATGAAIAAPDRPVICLQADGSAMYTVQALWTQAREGTNVTTVLLNNGSYAILRMELARVGATRPGAGGGPRAEAMLDLSRPDLDFTALAQGMGVPAVRVHTAADLSAELRRGVAEPGPHLIEAMIRPPS
jgi:acetolactate synthase-1/2/3 large subunit